MREGMTGKTEGEKGRGQEKQGEGEEEERERDRREREGRRCCEQQQEVCYCREGHSKPHTPQFKVHCHMSKLSYI